MLSKESSFFALRHIETGKTDSDVECFLAFNHNHGGFIVGKLFFNSLSLCSDGTLLLSSFLRPKFNREEGVVLMDGLLSFIILSE